MRGILCLHNINNIISYGRNERVKTSQGPNLAGTYTSVNGTEKLMTHKHTRNTYNIYLYIYIYLCI